MRPTLAGVAPRPVPGPTASETPTNPYSSIETGPRWLIQVDGGEFQLVESERELAELARLGRVTGSTPVYTVVGGPRALGEISDLVTFAPRPLISEPSVRSEPPPVRRDRRSPERAMLSEELAILNQPLEDDIEYYDEAPVRRWPKRVAFALAVAAGVLGAYVFVLPRFTTLRSSVTASFVLPARSWVAGAKPVAAPAGQAAALAVTARAPAIEAIQAAPPAGPAIEPANDATAAPAANAAAAPVAEQVASSPEAHKSGHSHRRHRSGNHASTRR